MPTLSADLAGKFFSGDVTMFRAMQSKSMAAAVLILAFVGIASAQPNVPTPMDLYHFQFGVVTDTAAPQGPMAQGRDGNLYGTGYYWGANQFGGVFKVTPSGSESLLASFPANDSGCAQGLTLGADGNFYGTCSQGFSSAGLLGNFYKITTAGVYTDLYDFKNAVTGEAYPNGPPILATDGNFYGITFQSSSSNGAIYKVTPAGNLTIVHTFGGGDSIPVGPLSQATDGNLYGAVLTAAGFGNRGGLFKVGLSGSGYKIIYGFVDATGFGPNTGVVQGSDGKLYGATSAGGTNSNGVIYRVSTSGTGYTVLYNLASTSTDGAPNTLIRATNGNLYGSSFGGGNGNQGDIWELTSANAYSDYLFSNSTNLGSNPAGPVVQHTNGTIYGTNSSGGVTGVGVFFSENIGASAFASLVTQSGKEGAKVGILGQGFSTSSVVKFGGTQATTKTLSGTTFITATVPTGALTGAVTVTTGTTTLTTPQSFRVTPVLTSFTPSTGPVGTVVTINGNGLQQTTKVTFNGKSASFTVVSDSQVTATVPTGATTGKIAVTTKGGTANSATNFTVM